MRCLRSLIAAGAAAALLIGCAPAMLPVGPPEGAGQVSPLSYSPHPSLKRQLDAILGAELLPYTNASIKVVSLTRGDTLYEYNARLLQSAASNQKLLTAAAALAILGKDQEITTTVALNPEAGTIYLKGCGDSMLTPKELGDLADAAARKMDRRKGYHLSGDVSCFDDQYWGKGWMWDDEPDPDEMYISPLSVNLNTITVKVSPGEVGRPAVVSVVPQSSLVKIDNRAVTAPPGREGSVAVTRVAGDRDNLVTVSGVVSRGAPPVERRLAVWKPELLALGLFGDALRARGITVKQAGIATTPAEAVTIAEKGRPVGDLVRFTLKESDNLAAESLLKLMALKATGKPGSADSGSMAIRNYLEQSHVPVEKQAVVDGSGVSRYNLTNADTLVRVLEAVYRDRDSYSLFYASLPIAGKDGTLAARMKGTSAEGNLRGKTGTMTGVSALSGYLDTADGEQLAFSIIIQNYTGSAQRARDVQDRIGALLCAFRRPL